MNITVLEIFTLHKFTLCACEVGLAGVFIRVVCICVQPQCQRCPVEDHFHKEPSLGAGSDGKRYHKLFIFLLLFFLEEF